ncbi:MAG: hypothetical protein MJ244_06200 [Clostridia bacterium]|nr:hypothetical protein [Clostridia bacterium]
MKGKDKKIVATIMLFLAFAVFALLPIILYERPFMKAKLSETDELAVLETQALISEDKALDRATLVNSEIRCSSVNELNKVEYYSSLNGTKYQVVTMFDSNYNIVESNIFNVDTAHSLMLVFFILLDMIACLTLIIFSAVLYCKSYR